MRRHRCDVLAVDQPCSHPSAGSGGGLLAQLANHAVGQGLTFATVSFWERCRTFKRHQKVANQGVRQPKRSIIVMG